ncbi:hypothetical protein [Mariniphaga sp.]|uniref:hypothetical protein n=1 Tax=Mariniphaga sp. TaxID=1954475 RepID=UPI00356A59E9
MNRTPDIAFRKAIYRNSEVLRIKFPFSQQFWEEEIGNPNHDAINEKESDKEVIVAKFATVEKVNNE